MARPPSQSELPPSFEEIEDEEIAAEVGEIDLTADAGEAEAGSVDAGLR